jgi:hypothetical protein
VPSCELNKKKTNHKGTKTQRTKLKCTNVPELSYSP